MRGWPEDDAACGPNRNCSWGLRLATVTCDLAAGSDIFEGKSRYNSVSPRGSLSEMSASEEVPTALNLNGKGQLRSEAFHSPCTPKPIYLPHTWGGGEIVLFSIEFVGALLAVVGMVTLGEPVTVKAIVCTTVWSIENGRLGRGRCPMCTVLGTRRVSRRY